jgi:hypothetical protein
VVDGTVIVDLEREVKQSKQFFPHYLISLVVKKPEIIKETIFLDPNDP